MSASGSSQHLTALALALALLLIPSGLPATRAADAPNAETSAVTTGHDNPWETYNAGVAAYERGDYVAAHAAWSSLAGRPLARGLRHQVPFQLGNVQFRLGEPLATQAPEQSVELWRRGRDAYQATLAVQPRHKAARSNLRLVEQHLAQATHRVGHDLLEKSRGEPVSPAIDLLRASLEHLEEAVALVPGEAPFLDHRAEARRQLEDRLIERARQSESDADALARQPYAPAETHAAEQYRDALADLSDAARTEPAAADDPRITQGTKRIEQKLADLLARAGQREQREGQENATAAPEEALTHYEAALERFQEAQQVSPHHEPAQRGEREVRAALEQLQVRQGREKLGRGREALAAQRTAAAQELGEALAHFEAAQDLNPANDEARRGADEARALLPEALTRLGRAEQKRGERSESDAAAALPHFEEAQSAFDRALQLQPGQGPAQKGLAEVNASLEKLRARLQQEAAKESARMAQLRAGKTPSLNDLLGQVDQRERPRETNRQRQRSQIKPSPRNTYPDW